MWIRIGKQVAIVGPIVAIGLRISAAYFTSHRTTLLYWLAIEIHIRAIAARGELTTNVGVVVGACSRVALKMIKIYSFSFSSTFLSFS